MRRSKLFVQEMSCQEELFFFRQQPSEPFYEAWKRFNQLVDIVQPYMSSYDITIMFYKGLNYEIRMWVNNGALMTGEPLLERSHEDVMHLLNDMADFDYEWHWNPSLQGWSHQYPPSSQLSNPQGDDFIENNVVVVEDHEEICDELQVEQETYREGTMQIHQFILEELLDQDIQVEKVISPKALEVKSSDKIELILVDEDVEEVEKDDDVGKEKGLMVVDIPMKHAFSQEEVAPTDQLIFEDLVDEDMDIEHTSCDTIKSRKIDTRSFNFQAIDELNYMYLLPTSERVEYVEIFPLVVEELKGDGHVCVFKDLVIEWHEEESSFALDTG